MSFFLIVPCYNEDKTLPLFLQELSEILSSKDIVCIVDDSTTRIQKQIQSIVNNLSSNVGYEIKLLRGKEKSGRGSAVKRAMEFYLSTKIQKDFILECDADGSHRIEDIRTILNIDFSHDFVIASRYLPNSQIIGWSKKRAVTSRFLNFFIPRLLLCRTSDITNGLRRYSRRSVNIICQYEQKTKGFMYLSQIALILRKNAIEPVDIPSIFLPRRAGSSSVGFNEFLGSLKDLLVLTMWAYKANGPRSID